MRIRIAASGVNPGDLKKRQGAGEVDQLGKGVPEQRVRREREAVTV